MKPSIPVTPLCAPRKRFSTAESARAAGVRAGLNSICPRAPLRHWNGCARLPAMHRWRCCRNRSTSSTSYWRATGPHLTHGCDRGITWRVLQLGTLSGLEATMSKWVPLSERLPEKSGVYPACSTIQGRSFPTDWMDALYRFEAEAKPGECKWQHGSGFYDNGLTHWLELSGPSHD